MHLPVGERSIWFETAQLNVGAGLVPAQDGQPQGLPLQPINARIGTGILTGTYNGAI